MIRPAQGRSFIGALIGCLALAAWASAAAPAHAAPAATHIMQLRPGVQLRSGEALVRAAGGRVSGRLGIINGLAVRLSRSERDVLVRDRRVVAIHANAAVRPRSIAIAGGGWSNDSSRLATAYPWSVRAPFAWASATGAGVGVAVIDTGIDGSRPDFASSDGSSRVVASVVTDPDATTAQDTYGHGTHVAGIIAGDGGRRSAGDPLAGRYVGIAPRARLVSIKAGDDDGHATV